MAASAERHPGGSSAGAFQKRRQHARRVEMLASNLLRAPRMERVVTFEAPEPLDRLLAGREAGQTGARGQMRGPTGVLHEDRTAGGQVAFAAVAEPSRPARDIRVLGHAELALRALDEVAIVPERTRDTHRVDRRPAVLAEQMARPVHGYFKALNGAPGHVYEPHELALLVAIDVREAVGLPRHHRGEPVPSRRFVGVPEAADHGLPGLVPDELPGRHVRLRRPDV